MSAILENLIRTNIVSAVGIDTLSEESDAVVKAIADAVSDYIANSVRVAPGQSVTTAGSPTAQTGATTTPGTLIAP